MNPAIFSDFENNAQGDVFLASVFCDGRSEQFILHSALAPLRQLHNIGQSMPENFAQSLVAQSKATGRPLPDIRGTTLRCRLAFVGPPDGQPNRRATQLGIPNSVGVLSSHRLDENTKLNVGQ